jgi:glutathione S-transferase
VRRSAHKLNLPLEYRDVRKNDEHREALEQGGGKVQVPCLRIDGEDETQWMYESDDIIDYLETKFG